VWELSFNVRLPMLPMYSRGMLAPR
jgi:hypothetical protein